MKSRGSDVCKFAFVSLSHSWLPSYDDKVGDDSTEVKYKSECNSCQRWSTLRQCQRWSTPPALQFAKVRPMLVTKSCKNPITLYSFKPSICYRSVLQSITENIFAEKRLQIRCAPSVHNPRKKSSKGLKWCFGAKKIVHIKQIRGVSSPSLPTKIYGFEGNIE